MSSTTAPAIPPLYCLPCLHPALASFSARLPGGLRESAAHLWPGLPGMPATGYRCPADLPFSPRQAERCLADVAESSAVALTGAPLGALLTWGASAAAFDAVREQEALAVFARTATTDNPSPDADAALRCAAHATLLRAWVMEEQQLELRALVADFGAQARQFGQHLGLAADDALELGASAALNAATSPLPQEEAAAPPWRVVLECASLLLAPECVFVCNSATMREELLECAEPTEICLPAANVSPLSGFTVPLGTLLGKRSEAALSRRHLAQTRTILL